MGTRGPQPKRDAERRRRNKPETPTETVQVVGDVEVPAADPRWHDLAKRAYQALQDSGQARYLEPSDWAVVCIALELLSKELRSAKPSPTMINQIMSTFSSLGMTEGDRRRMRIEIERRKHPKPVEVSHLAGYRERFNAG